jgi:chromosome segregation ATPase
VYFVNFQLKLFVINHLTKCKVEKEKLYKQNSVLQQERSKLLKENTKLQSEKGALQAENELLNEQLQKLTEQNTHISQELKSLQLDGVCKSRTRSRRHGKTASQDHIIVKLEDGALESLQPASDDSNLTEQIEEMSQLWSYIESYNSTLAKAGQHVVCT